MEERTGNRNGTSLPTDSKERQWTGKAQKPPLQWSTPFSKCAPPSQTVSLNGDVVSFLSLQNAFRSPSKISTVSLYFNIIQKSKTSSDTPGILSFPCKIKKKEKRKKKKRKTITYTGREYTSLLQREHIKTYLKITGPKQNWNPAGQTKNHLVLCLMAETSVSKGLDSSVPPESLPAI